MDTVAEANALVAADKVQGATIHNTTGENLGSINDIVIDRKSGTIAYAIVSVGGFFGIGSRYHPLPWSMLKYDAKLGGYVADLDRAQLEQSPAYGRWH